MNADKKLKRELSQETQRCVDINFRSAILALFRYKKWDDIQLKSFLTEMRCAFEEVSKTEKSSMQMLQEETGIELQNGDGKHWYDLPYLNDYGWGNIKQVTSEQVVYIRQQQKKWLKTSLMATILYVMYKMFGWTMEEDLQLIEWMNEIENECNNNAKQLNQKMIDEIGVSLIHKGSDCIDLIYVDDRWEEKSDEPNN